MGGVRGGGVGGWGWGGEWGTTEYPIPTNPSVSAPEEHTHSYALVLMIGMLFTKHICSFYDFVYIFVRN